MTDSARTILYIEDNVDNRILVRRILRAEGYDVLEAGDARETLQVVTNRRPDLILVDINMPEVDNYTLTSRLNSDPNLSTVPVIAITANIMRGDRERTLAAGCDGYIQKPIDVDYLPRQIARFLYREDWERDEEALAPERDGSLLQARRSFITLLVSRSGSSMRKSFALCEAFGLTPFPLSAGKLPPTQPSVAERPSAPCTALRAAQCKCRYGRLRTGRISRRRGAFGPPPPSKPHPSPG